MNMAVGLWRYSIAYIFILYWMFKIDVILIPGEWFIVLKQFNKSLIWVGEWPVISYKSVFLGCISARVAKYV